MRRLLVWSLALGAIGALGGWLTLQYLLEQAATRELPYVKPVSIEPFYRRPPPIPITVTAHWLKVPMRVTPHAILTDEALWRRMHFDDWDRVPLPLRRDGMAQMVARYRHLLRAPREWDRMTADDWDLVPQPVRAMAFMNMMRYWSGYYQVGASHGLPRGAITHTLNAIMMVESWFEHRAVQESGGNRDLGLGQMSDFARETLARLARRGTIDFAPDTDEDYFNPWQATRMTAIWLDVMLDEQRGDLDGAIRAYHRGSPYAGDQAGRNYLANVAQKRRRFMREHNGTPAWGLLVSLT